MASHSTNERYINEDEDSEEYDILLLKPEEKTDFKRSKVDRNKHLKMVKYLNIMNKMASTKRISKHNVINQIMIEK